MGDGMVTEQIRINESHKIIDICSSEILILTDGCSRKIQQRLIELLGNFGYNNISANSYPLAIYELTTLPEADIVQATSDVLKVNIRRHNGCVTKGSKERTIEIPCDIAQEGTVNLTSWS